MKQNNDAIKKHKPSILEFSDKAIAHFQKQLATKPESTSIRIGIQEAGCSGYEYYFKYENNQHANDTGFSFDGCLILVDQDSLNLLKGSLVDYDDDEFNSGIKFHNPNAKAVCGCGESFTID
tara:strand:+ start:1108 stop:1473 length:366 start_codon:yes stop_codon:yes gene_type:complete